MRWRRLLLNLHLYGGLLVCWYLLLFGYSSLAFNHPWVLPVPNPEASEWERSLPPELERLPDNEAMAQIRDELGLIGWPLPWTMEKVDGALTFELSRPGKRYEIHYDGGMGAARVTEHSTGVASIVRALHGLAEEIPGSGFSRVWGVYTEITTWFVLFAIVSGAVLWGTRKRVLRGGLLLAVISAIASAALMFLLGAN